MWPEKHGKTWRVRDEVGGHKVTLLSGLPNKTTAKNAIVQLRAEQLRGDALVPRGGKMTLAEWLDVWQPAWEAGLKPSSAKSEPARIRNHIRPRLGAYTLDDLTPLVVQRFVSGLNLSPKTIRNVHGLLHKILAAAVHARYVRANPCDHTILPRVVRREMRFLTEPEAARLLAHTPTHWRPLVLLLLSTGLRWGEAVGLRVGDVDVLAGRLTVLRTMHELTGSAEIVFTEPKSMMSRRTVTFDRKTAAALVPLVSGKHRDQLVFTSPRGGPVRIRNFRRSPRNGRPMGWARWCADAGLAGLRIHDLRHTHAAWLISAGVVLTGVQRRLGHSSIAVTSDLYGHLMPVVDESILAAVDAALAGVDLDTMAAEVESELAEV
jgi:integrase